MKNLIPETHKKIRMGANCEFFEEIQERELLHYHTLFFRLLLFRLPSPKILSHTQSLWKKKKKKRIIKMKKRIRKTLSLKYAAFSPSFN